MKEVPLCPCSVQFSSVQFSRCAHSSLSSALWTPQHWTLHDDMMIWCFASHLGLPFSFVFFSVFLISILLLTNAASIMSVLLLLPDAARALCNGVQNVANERLIQSVVPRDGVLVSLHCKWRNSVDWGCRGECQKRQQECLHPSVSSWQRDSYVSTRADDRSTVFKPTLKIFSLY